MSTEVEVEFVSHCDEEGCTLGYAEYECPSCSRQQQDFADLWFERDAVRDGSVLIVSCELCQAKLKAFYDEDRFSVFIVEDKNAA